MHIGSLLISDTREDLAHLRLPWSIDDAKDLGQLLSRVKETHYLSVLATVAITYVLYP